MSNQVETDQRWFGLNQGRAALALATHSITLGAIPVFLLGALAVFVREDLGFSEFKLGQVASAYYATSAIASVPGGRIVERIGTHKAIALAAVLGGGAMAGIAILANSWGALLGFMMIAGIGNGISLPASNLMLAQGVSPRRQGIAFGVKQSSGPIATLIAGLCVPLIGLSVGWRWAFVLVTIAAIPLLFVGRSGDVKHDNKARPSGSIHVGPLVVLSIGACLAVIGGSSLAAFYVESAVNGGISAGMAGTLLAVGSVAGIAARISWGWIGGRSHSAHVPLLGLLLVVGGSAYFLLGQVTGVIPLGAVTLVVVTTGWGWPALFNFAVVTRSPGSPAGATGIIGTGLYSGGIIGPVAFGAIVESSGYSLAWAFVSCCAVASGTLFYIGGRQLEHKDRFTR